MALFMRFKIAGCGRFANAVPLWLRGDYFVGIMMAPGLRFDTIGPEGPGEPEVARPVITVDQSPQNGAHQDDRAGGNSAHLWRDQPVSHQADDLTAWQ